MPIKRFYSIGEVSKMVNEEISTLRYWERIYPQLSPKKSRKGTRYYSESDIQKIKEIIFLIREQKLTHEGAGSKLVQHIDTIEARTKILSTLNDMREELLAMRAAIDTEKRKRLAQRVQQEEAGEASTAPLD